MPLIQVKVHLQGDIVPDDIVYNSLLDGCAKQHRTEDALHVLKDIKVAPVRSSNFTSCILVKLFGQEKHLHKLS